MTEPQRQLHGGHLPEGAGAPENHQPQSNGIPRFCQGPVVGRGIVRVERNTRQPRHHQDEVGRGCRCAGTRQQEQGQGQRCAFVNPAASAASSELNQTSAIVSSYPRVPGT